MAMVNVNDLFVKATNDVKLLPGPLDNDTLLLLYGFYKQATIGDVNTEKPSFLNFKEVAKWNTWAGLKGMQKIQAQGNYIKNVKDLQIKCQK